MIRVGLPRRIDNASGGSVHCAGALKLRSLALGIFTGVSGFGFFAHASMLNSFLRFFSGVLTDMVLRRRASQSLFEFASTHKLEWILLLLLQDIEEAAQIFPLDTTVPILLKQYRSTQTRTSISGKPSLPRSSEARSCFELLAPPTYFVGP